MTRGRVLWVLGHPARPLETDTCYGMVDITSPPLHGTLDIMSAGQWRRCPAGSFLELPPNTPHTFINRTEKNVAWMTGWRLKGFERFFRAFGIPAEEAGARERSVAEAVVQKVVQNLGT